MKDKEHPEQYPEPTLTLINALVGERIEPWGWPDLRGDFSFGGQGLPIYNPFTTRQDETGKWIRDPFPGNIIPANLFDPVAKNFLARNPFAKPNDPGITTRTGPQQNLNLLESKIVRAFALGREDRPSILAES